MSPLFYSTIIALLPLTYCYDWNCALGEINGEGNRICCNGEEYFVRNNPKYYSACNVEPKDENLSYEDSIFLMYDCHVRKWLGSKPLTVKTYATLMSHVSSSKNPLWKKLPPNETVIEAKDEKQRIETIKILYNEFLRAIREVCLYGSSNQASSLNNEELAQKKEDILRLTEDAPCQNATVPSFLVMYYNYYNDYGSTNSFNLKKCKDEIKDFIGEIKSQELYKNATMACLAVHFKNIKMSDIKNPNFDFENITSKFFPAFWSKSTKNLARDMIIHSLKQTYGEVKRVRDFLRLMRNDVQLEIDDALEDGRKNIFPLQGESLTNTNAVVNAYLAGKLYAIFWPIRDYDMCAYGTDYRNLKSTRLL